MNTKLALACPKSIANQWRAQCVPHVILWLMHAAGDAPGPSRNAGVKKLLDTMLEWVELVVHKGCRTEEDRLEAAYLSTDIVVEFIDAGFPHTQLSNYLCLLPLIMAQQPIQDTRILTGGQFINIPKDMDPLDKPTCLKDTNDGTGELQHRLGKQHNTNSGGGIVAQHQDTIHSDTAKRDLLGQLQRLERHQLVLLERVVQKCPLPARDTRVAFKKRMGEWGGASMSVEAILQLHVDHQGLQYMTQKDIAAADPLMVSQLLSALQSAADATGLTENSVWSWLKRKACPRAEVPANPRRLKPKLAEATGVPATPQPNDQQQQQQQQQEQQSEGAEGGSLGGTGAAAAAAAAAAEAAAVAARLGQTANPPGVRRSSRQASAAQGSAAAGGQAGVRQPEAAAAPRRQRKRAPVSYVEEGEEEEEFDAGLAALLGRGHQVANKRARQALLQSGEDVDDCYMQE
jgi:hypothetical protein